MKIKLLLLSLLATLSLGAFAQSGGITARVVSRVERAPIEGVTITTTPATGSVKTNAEGVFTLTGIEDFDYMVELAAPGYETLSVVARVEGGVKDLYTIVLVPEMQLSVIDDSIFAEFDSDMGDGMAAPATLAASKDVFSSIASYKFSEMRFSQRGYDSKYSEVYLNGINMNDALTGYSPWSLWGGLNEATRNQEATIGLASSTEGVGGLNGSTNILARASQVRQGWSTSVVNANNMYRYRVMLTYASGMKDNGWAYAFSLSTRQGNNDYVDGIFYNTLGYFASVEKKINDRHRVSLTFLGAPTERGAQQASTQEVYDLLGNNYYNPNMGIQNGELRNTRIKEFHEPIAIANYNFKIDDRTELDVATSLRFGQNGYSALTWCAGSDPRPDYYRYLPSYYACPNPAELAERWSNNVDNLSLIDFDALYQINYNGTSNDIYGEGNRSYYMIEERHTDQLDYNFAAQVTRQLKGGSSYIVGVTARRNRTENYSSVKDLMGGDYWIDVDKFAERDFGSNEEAYQNNLEYYYANGNTAQAVKEGDKYSYDYYSHLLKTTLWGSYNHVFGFLPNLSLNLSGEVGYSSMWREGLWRKGLFPDDSYGESDKIDNVIYKAKANVSYIINRSLSVVANAAVMNNAPTMQSAFVSPRTRNMITPFLDTEKIQSYDLALNGRLGDAKFRVAGYYTTIKDQNRVISFYNDLESSFDNFAMSGIDERYAGIEAAFSVPLIAGISINGAASVGEYIYNSNPYYIEMADNSAGVLSQGTVNWSGYKVEGTPQTALNLGLGYRSPGYPFLALDLNYYDNNYLSMNPLCRTDNVLNSYMLTPGNEALIEAMRSQEKFDGAYTLSGSIGKSWYINREYQLGLSFEMKNILNNQNLRTGGYEQMRINEAEVEGSSSDTYFERFDSKYFYMLGRTYYLNVYFRF